jgi:lipoyl(octanoyl) transferase
MNPRVEFLDRGVIDYAVALERQRELFDRLIAGKSNCGSKTQVSSKMAGCKACDGAERGTYSNVCNEFGDERNEADGRFSRKPAAGWLVVCEHPHVYTLGRSGRADNLLVSETVLRERGAALYRTERGGDITYHGPGQIVGYPILDLERLGFGLREYIAALEQAVIETVAHFGIAAGRVEGKTGVWVGGEVEKNTERFRQSGDHATLGEKNGSGSLLGVNDRAIFETAEAESPLSRKPERKICAIGVKASRGVVMHGFALNVATDLKWFDLINPCGMVGGAVTSMERETGCGIVPGEVKKVLCGRLCENLGISL